MFCTLLSSHESIRHLVVTQTHGVVEVHDLHIWAMSTTETALTAHLVMPGNACAPTFLTSTCTALHDKFDIDHSTLQIDAQEAPIP